MFYNCVNILWSKKESRNMTVYRYIKETNFSSVIFVCMNDFELLTEKTVKKVR